MPALFAVVFDRPSFVTERGCPFAILHDFQDRMEALDINLVNFRRSVGIPELAKRFTMIVVEERTYRRA